MPRLVVLGVILVALVVVAAVVLIPHGGKGAAKTAASSVVLPPPWRVDVNVLKGSGAINYTRQVASRAQALGHSHQHAGRADNFSYPQTTVSSPPDCEGLALRLAKQLGVTRRPLPGGSGPCRL